MALITCPECGEKISDKADICIHCGYPIKNYIDENSKIEEENKYCIVNGVKYDFSPILKSILNNEHKSSKMMDQMFPEISPSTRTYIHSIIYNTHKIPEVYSKKLFDEVWDKKYQEKQREKLIQKGIDPDAPAACPSCGSTQFSTLQRGHSLIFGWLGSGEPQNVCQKCGYKWTPGRR